MKIDEFSEKSEEDSRKEPEDYIRFVYYEPDTLPNLFGGQGDSSPESPKSPKILDLQPMQPESWSKRPKSHSKGPKLPSHC